MQINFSFRNTDSSEAVKTYASEKIGKLQKFLRSPLHADVRVTIEKHMHIVDIALTADGDRFAGHEESESAYASIDLVMEKLDRQVRELKASEVDRKRHPH